MHLPQEGLPATRTVHLSADSDAGQIPDSVTLNAGEDSVTFPIVTSEVNVPTALTVQAEYQETTAEAVLIIRPPNVTTSCLPARLINLEFLSGTVLTGGQTVTGRVTLENVAISGGQWIDLSDLLWTFPNGETVELGRVPAGVLVPEGETTANFTLRVGSITPQVAASITESGGLHFIASQWAGGAASTGSNQNIAVPVRECTTDRHHSLPT